MLAIIAMWLYALSPLAKRAAPDTMHDTSIGPRAESFCKRTFEEIDRLPKAFDTADPVARADVVGSSNQLLASMVDELESLHPSGDRDEDQNDSRMYGEWIADWRTYLGNRQDYVARLRTDRNARMFMAQKGAKQITEPIGGFARSNSMPSCQPPGDIV